MDKSPRLRLRLYILMGPSYKNYHEVEVFNRYLRWRCISLSPASYLLFAFPQLPTMAPQHEISILLVVLIPLLQLASMVAAAGHETCKFPAIFNLGDSNSDTGGLSASIGPTPWPNGETYFRVPAGRACDGRLMVDFMGTSVCYLLS